MYNPIKEVWPEVGTTVVCTQTEHWWAEGGLHRIDKGDIGTVTKHTYRDAEIYAHRAGVTMRWTRFPHRHFEPVDACQCSPT